jgi:hypothetical protein
MHTLKVIAAGLALLALCILVGRSVGGASPAAGVALGLKAFVPLWFIGAAINLWAGVSRAGYTVAEEVPVFAVVFTGPVAVGVLIWWLAARTPG